MGTYLLSEKYVHIKNSPYMRFLYILNKYVLYNVKVFIIFTIKFNKL